jgi:hypothetical protein
VPGSVTLPSYHLAGLLRPDRESRQTHRREVRDGNFSFVITGVERIDVFSDGVTVGL